MIKEVLQENPKIEIVQADCLEYMKQIPDEAIDMCLTDPPYGMKYQSAWRTATPKFDKIQNDNNIDWFNSFIFECYRVLKNNTHIYIFCNDYAISEFRNLMNKVGFTIKRTLVWVKNNHTSGDLFGDYGNKTEFIIYAQKGRKLLNGKRDTNVLFYDKVSKLQHPTQKPIDLNEFLIQKSSNICDIILDPFMGSGSTGVAAKNLNRGFIGIEMQPEYYQIAKNRINESSTSK